MSTTPLRPPSASQGWKSMLGMVVELLLPQLVVQDLSVHLCSSLHLKTVSGKTPDPSLMHINQYDLRDGGKSLALEVAEFQPIQANKEICSNLLASYKSEGNILKTCSYVIIIFCSFSLNFSV